MPAPQGLPRAFVWRRLHSLSGIFFALFLAGHLLVNSQAALFLGDDGSGFIHSVNHIHNLPYLPIIEIVLLGVPIAIHLIYGIKYLRTAKYNSFGVSGKSPNLHEYPRNRAYTWQRITAWILAFALIAHVVQMRFIDSPASARRGTENFYMVRLTADDGLYPLAERLGVKLYDKAQIQQQKDELLHPSPKHPENTHPVSHLFSSFTSIIQKPKKKEAAESKPQALIQAQQRQDNQAWLHALEQKPLAPGELIAVAPNFGTAELLVVRDTFKIPLMLALYTIFVLTACYHAYNGLWSSMIKWGVTLTEYSQKVMLKISIFIMFAVAFMGLAAIWATYWINLKH